MKILVRLFAMTRDIVGRSEIDLNLPEGTTAEAAIEQLVVDFPALAAHVSRLAVAVDLEYVPRSHVLQNGQELALIPPVSGG